MPDDKTPQPSSQDPTQQPLADTGQPMPPPGKIDLERARYWAGRGPQGQPLRRNRPPYSIT